MVRRNVNILTYKAVVSLQNNIPAQLERCWTQEPAILEDALGRVTPIHLEFLDSWEVSWQSPGETLGDREPRCLTRSRLSRPCSRFVSANYQAIERLRKGSMHYGLMY